MENHAKIEAHKITTPISLVASWLVALCFVIGSLLTAALAMPESSWMRGVLVVAVVVYIPGAFWFIYRMQTTHRDKLLADNDFMKNVEAEDKSKDHFRWAIEQILNEYMEKEGLPISVGRVAKLLGSSWSKDMVIDELSSMVAEEYIVCHDDTVTMSSFIDYPEWVKNG